MHPDLQKSYDRLTKDARMLRVPEFMAIPLMGGTIEICFGIERFGDRPFTTIRTTAPLAMAGAKIEFAWCMEGCFVLDGRHLAHVSSKPQVSVVNGLLAFGGVGGDSIEYPTYSHARDRMGVRIREFVNQIYPVVGTSLQDELHDLLLQAVADNLDRFRTREPSTERNMFGGPFFSYEENAMEGLTFIAGTLPMASRSHCLLIEDTHGRPVRLQYDGRTADACSFDVPAGRMAGIVWPSLRSLWTRVDRAFVPEGHILSGRFMSELGIVPRIASVSWDAIEVLEGNGSGGPGGQVGRHCLKHEDVVDWADLVASQRKDTVPA